MTLNLAEREWAGFAGTERQNERLDGFDSGVWQVEAVPGSGARIIVRISLASCGTVCIPSSRLDLNEVDLNVVNSKSANSRHQNISEKVLSNFSDALIMTSIDPSHFPSLSLASGDPTGGKAVHQPTSPSEESLFSSYAHESQPAGRLFPPFAIPDLRYEQGYLMSLRPFFYLQRKATKFGSSQPRDQLTYDIPSTEDIDNMFYLGRNFRVKWPLVIWVTLRDQMLYPIMQGCLWGTLSLVLAQVLRARTSARSCSLPGDKPSGLWGRMVRNLIGGAKLNTV